MDRLKKILAQRYLLTPGICLTIGMVLHFKGIKLSEQGRDSLQQFVASIFDLLALIAGQSSARFSLSQKKQKQLEKAVDINAAVTNPMINTGPQLPVTVSEVAAVEERK